MARTRLFDQYVLSEWDDSEEGIGTVTFRTYHEAAKAMKEAWAESLPAGGLRDYWGEMSYLDEWCAIMYRNGEDVVSWDISQIRDERAERIVTDLMRRVISDEPAVTSRELACFLQERGVPEEDALGFVDDAFGGVLRDGPGSPDSVPDEGTRAEGGGSDV